MAGKIKNIQVKIFNRNYQVRTNEDLRYFKSLVDDLNARITDAEKSHGKFPDIQILSLIALQILDEKSKIEKEYKQMKDLAKKMELGSNKI